MSQLRLAFLGSFQAAWAGEPLIGFRSDKTRALLAYLAVMAERPQRREHLAALLWGEQAAARASLRMALSNLRQVLAAVSLNGVHPLTITRQTAVFHLADQVWLDTGQFDSLIRQCQTHPHDAIAHCLACLPRLRQAAALYRGDFLAGLTLAGSPAFAEWQRMEQERRHQQALAALAALTAHHLQINKYDTAISHARRQLSLSPWLESAHRQLMQALAQSGQRAAALAQFESCRQVLADELGSEPEPETRALYQQIKDGRFAPHHTPPAAAPAVPPHNLPLAATPFIGRAAELAQLQERLLDPDYRLITLTGEGGVGKTRLALAAARQTLTYFPDGAWFVPLADLEGAANPADAIAAAIANTLDMTGSAAAAAPLPHYLRHKRLLLILDNLEHLIAEESVSLLLAVLTRAPGVTLLVTSRARLNAQAEWPLRLHGLPVPPNGAEAADAYAGTALFAERAGRAFAGFRLDETNRLCVAEICRLVAGLPLAIELAAAWTSHYTCAEIAQAVRQNLDFLAVNRADLPPRHRSLRAAITHSWALLPAAEQAALAKLAVFRRSFSRAAAAEVSGVSLPQLAALVDKSLLRVERTEGQARYGRHPLIAQFARQKLAALPQAAVESALEAHARYYGRLLQAQAADLMGGQPAAALAVIRPELANIRQAWLWAARQGETAVINQMADPVLQAFDLMGLYRETARLAAAGEALAAADLSRPADALALGRVWGMAAAAHFRLGDYEMAQKQSRRALEQLAPFQPHIAYAHALVYAGCAAFGLGRLDEVGQHWRAAAAAYAAVSSRWGEAISCSNLAELLLTQGRAKEAREFAQQGHRLAQEMGNREIEGNTLGCLAALAAGDGRFAEAMRLGRQAVACHRQTGNEAHLANALASLAQAALGRQMLTEARAYLTESVTLLRRCGNHFYLVNRLLELGRAALAQADVAAATAAAEEALQEAAAAQAGELICRAALFLAELRQRQERPAAAVQLAAFVLGQTAVSAGMKAEAESILAEADGALSPADFEAAQRAGSRGHLPV